MNNRKSNKKSIALVAILVIVVLAVTAVAQKATKTQAPAVLTDPHLVAAQAKQNELVAVKHQLEAALKREKLAYDKIASLQASYRAGEAGRIAELAAKDGDIQTYQNLWQRDRKVTPWYAGVYAGMLYGVVGLLLLQIMHRRVLKIHGSYQKWLKHRWQHRPRINWRGAAHG